MAMWNLQHRRQSQSSRSSPQAIKKQQSLSPSSSPRNNQHHHHHHHQRGPPFRISIRRVCQWLIFILAVVLVSCTLHLVLKLRKSSSSLPSQEDKLRHLLLRRHDTKDEELQREIYQFLFDDNTDHPKPLSPTLQHLLDTWESPLVHIVNTRFMQEQGRLKALGRARLLLFETFCLPTMMQQSTQDFLWIVKTDPQLDHVLLRDLLQLVQPYSNIYLVASNQNYMIRDTHSLDGRHSWRDGAEIQDLLASPIYTGNTTRLYQAMLQKDDQVVLETRLDADDGLHRFYLQQIQDKALDQFGVVTTELLDEEGNNQQQQDNNQHEKSSTKPPPKWLYWCTRRHVEWHGGVQQAPKVPVGIHRNGTLLEPFSSVDYYGSLLVVEHSKLCITPGITVGFGIGTPASDVPIHAHDKLFQAIRSLPKNEACGYERVKACLELVEDFLLVAIRARTPTSAGMQRVGVEEDDDDDGKSNNHTAKNKTDSNIKQNTKKKKKKKRQPKKPHVSNLRMYLYWDLLHDDFGVLREQIRYTNQYILNHLVPIARDNLEGQCTSDHSCKNETKEKLLKIISDNGG